MASKSRYFQSLPDSVALKTAYGGDHEGLRMSSIRPYIERTRKAWASEDTYRALMVKIRRHFPPNQLPEDARAAFHRLLDGFRDYGDIDMRRSQKPLLEQFDAIEIYTSAGGFDELYRLMGDVMRKDKPLQEELEVATALVELLTIDLYNLRLSQIGHPSYANFEGVTYRGLSISDQDLKEYEAILARPKLQNRNFSVPLGLISSSTDQKVMGDFSKTNYSPGRILVHMTIYIRGIDGGLLQQYHRLYPDSVVTSICAMPVGHLSPYGEKEVLLRGPFFHLVSMTQDFVDGRPYQRMVVVMMNANRDHGMEHASDREEKERQRKYFLKIVSASKFKLCAQVASACGTSLDAEGYDELARAALAELQETTSMRASLTIETTLPEGRNSSTVATWLGGSLIKSYPHYYAAKRLDFQNSIWKQDWVSAWKQIDSEYDWKRREWYNVGKLTENGEKLVNDNLTLLHILATKPQPSSHDEAQFAAWRRILEGACQPEVWSMLCGLLPNTSTPVYSLIFFANLETLRSFDTAQVTAYQLSREFQSEYLAEHLRPIIIHKVDDAVILNLESQLYEIMLDKAGRFLQETTFHMPQLSVLTEMEIPELWIPIPLMYGGFFVTLESSEQIKVVFHEVAIGESVGKKTEFHLRPVSNGDSQAA